MERRKQFGSVSYFLPELMIQVVNLSRRGNICLTLNSVKSMVTHKGTLVLLVRSTDECL